MRAVRCRSSERHSGKDISALPCRRADREIRRAGPLVRPRAGAHRRTRRRADRAGAEWASEPFLQHGAVDLVELEHAHIPVTVAEPEGLELAAERTLALEAVGGRHLE